MTINVVTPYSQVFADVQNAMVAALQAIQTKETGLIAQGQILPDDMAAMTATANAALAAAVPAGVTIPPSLQALFTQWVTMQLAGVEDQVQIAYDQYQESLLTIQLSQYKADLAADATQVRLRPAPRDVGARRHGGEQRVHRDPYPAPRVRGSGVLPHDEDQIPDLRVLLREPLRLDPHRADHGPRLREHHHAAGAGSLDALGWRPVGVQLRLRAIAEPEPRERHPRRARVPESRLPRPGGLRRGSALPDQLPDGGLVPPQWTVADPGSSQSLWNAFNTGSTATITITPEELYYPGGRAVLSCGRVTPVIDNMMLYVGLQSSDTRFNFNAGNSGTGLTPVGSGMQVPFLIHPSETFALATGPSLWQWDTMDPAAVADLTSGPMEIWAGQDNLASTYANTIFMPQLGTGGVPTGTYAETSVGGGMSPFITFDVSFQAATAAWANVQPRRRRACRLPPCQSTSSFSCKSRALAGRT